MSKAIKILLVSAVLFFVPILVCAKANNPSETKSEPNVEKIIQERVDTYKKSAGIVVGVVSPTANKITSYGKTSFDSKTNIGEKTIFEIASVSKVFTSLLLADMVEKGEVKLDDPISKFLPKSVKTPTKNGKEITLLHLATHTSGLPRLPTNLFAVAKDLENPYADYTQEHLYDFLSNYNLTREIGAGFEYSNLGMGLLGHILSLRAGLDYETLVVTRICKPLEMNDTKINLSLEEKARLSMGHNEDKAVVKNWQFASLAGAGGLRSTVADMLKFLSAYLNFSKTPLSAAMERSLKIYEKTNIPDTNIGLGWFLSKHNDRELFWHNGQTAGYHSYITFDRKTQTGVVVLSNSTNDIEDIGRHLIDSKYNLFNFEKAKERKAIEIDSKIFDLYVGQYQLTPEFILTISREGERFFVQATGQSRLEIFAESKEKFFLTQVDAQIEFIRDEKGKIIEAILYQGGRSTPGKKIK
ncbi:MAG: serine hydrolase [Acidobacteria bacterium]|nr:serine hydrolase [Acidobacteriota bacterium]